MKLDSLKLFITFCLCILLVGLLFTQKTSEGFEDSKMCSTAGLKPSDACIGLFKNGGFDITNYRVYTRSECAKLENSHYGGPFTCTNKMNNTNYVEKCADLNKSVKSVLPNECKLEGSTLGKASAAFKVTAKGKKTYQVEHGALQLYTSNECKLLKGKFQKLEDVLRKEYQAPEDEILVAVKENGEEYGTCHGDDAAYSIVCTAEQTLSLASNASASAKSAVKNWLK